MFCGGLMLSVFFPCWSSFQAMKLYLDVDSQWFCEKLARDPSSSKGAKTDLKFFKINAMGPSDD